MDYQIVVKRYFNLQFTVFNVKMAEDEDGTYYIVFYMCIQNINTFTKLI